MNIEGQSLIWLALYLLESTHDPPPSLANRWGNLLIIEQRKVGQTMAKQANKSALHLSSDGKLAVVVSNGTAFATPTYTSDLARNTSGRPGNLGYVYLSLIRDKDGELVTTPEMVQKAGLAQLSKVIDENGRIIASPIQLREVNLIPIESMRGEGPDRNTIVHTDVVLKIMSDTRRLDGVQIVNGVGVVGEYDPNVREIIPEVGRSSRFDEAIRPIVEELLGKTFEIKGIACTWTVRAVVKTDVPQEHIEHLQALAKSY